MSCWLGTRGAESYTASRRRATTTAQLASISVRVGRLLTFDPECETISGDESANDLIRRRYRQGHCAAGSGMVHQIDSR